LISLDKLFTFFKQQIEVQKAINKENANMTELIRDFLDPADFFNACQKIANIGFYCGVPDSLLKDFCAYVSSNTKENHVITANEGAAVAMAAGYHLATNKNSMVYLQNSGLGNIVNPLMSLCKCVFI
jgi:phosphonopyruvate decarboxylase